MKTLLISDLHLSPDHPDITQAFSDFINQYINSSIENLYILGDLFQAYLGDDEINSNIFLNQVIQLIKNIHIKYKTKIYIMRGNRDFLINNILTEHCQAELIPDPYKVNLYGKDYLLAHGDQFCTQDRLYQIYKKIIQHRISKNLLLKLSLDTRKKIALFLRNKSKNNIKNKYINQNKYSKNRINNQDGVDSKTVLHYAREYKTDVIIHGHTHRPNVHYHQLNHHVLTRYVIPDWHPKGGMIIIDSDKNQPELVILD